MNRLYTNENFPDNNLTDVNCAICSDVIFTPFMIIECGHIFCEECIKKWIEINNTCPTCREKIILKPIINRNFITHKINLLNYHCMNGIKNANQTETCDAIINIDSDYKSIKKHIDECNFRIMICSFCYDSIIMKNYNSVEISF